MVSSTWLGYNEVTLRTSSQTATCFHGFTLSLSIAKCQAAEIVLTQVYGYAALGVESKFISFASDTYTA